MRPRRAVLLAATVAAVLLLLHVAAAAGQVMTAVVDPDGGWDHHQRVGVAACTGTVEECVVAGGGTGTARRELANGGYISYDAMSRGRVPCSYRGASYYNCRPGGPANPYSRGCSAITRCRG